MKLQLSIIIDGIGALLIMLYTGALFIAPIIGFIYGFYARAYLSREQTYYSGYIFSLGASALVGWYYSSYTQDIPWCAFCSPYDAQIVAAVITIVLTTLGTLGLYLGVLGYRIYLRGQTH